MIEQTSQEHLHVDTFYESALQSELPLAARVMEASMNDEFCECWGNILEKRADICGATDRTTVLLLMEMTLNLLPISH